MPDNNSKKRFEEALNLPHNPAIYTMYDGYHIDTCDIYLEKPDIHIRETAIWKQETHTTVVVERYSESDDLMEKHFWWVRKLRDDPEFVNNILKKESERL